MVKKVVQQSILFIFLFLSSGLSIFAQQADLFKSDGIMYEGQMDYPKAAISYEKAVEAYDNKQITDSLCIFKAGQNFVRCKQYAKALSFLNRSVEINYNDAQVYLSLSQAYEGLKQYNEAITPLENGIKIYSDSQLSFLKRLGYLYFKTGKYQQAIDNLNQALALEPEDENLLFLAANSYDKLENYDSAIESLEKILSINPNHKKSVYLLGLEYYKQTDAEYKKEKKRYEALKSPSRVDFHNSTVKLDSISQRYKKALPYFEKALESSPANKSIAGCLAVCYKRLDMKDKEAEIVKLL